MPNLLERFRQLINGRRDEGDNTPSPYEHQLAELEAKLMQINLNNEANQVYFEGVDDVAAENNNNEIIDLEMPNGRNRGLRFADIRPMRHNPFEDIVVQRKEVDMLDENGTLCHQTGKKFKKEFLRKSKANVKYNAKKDKWTYDDVYISCPDFEAIVMNEKTDSIHIADRDEAIKCGFIESLKDGMFYTSEEAKAKLESQYRPISYKRFGIKDAQEDRLTTKEQIKYGMYSPTDIITQNKGYSFGVEIETSAGYIAQHLYKNLNMKSVQDGSILDARGRKTFDDGNYIGREYVTGVLRGDAGFKQLEKICNTISRRCSVNKTCGVHVHVGGLEFTKEKLVLIYKLAKAIEDDIFSLLPPSRRGNEYCTDLKKFKFDLSTKDSKEEYDIKIDEYYISLFKHLAGTTPSKRYNKEKQHPRGARAGYDRSHPRYDWLNFMPAMFNIRDVRKYDPTTKKEKIVSYTLELRNHSGTTNYTKIKNWVLITMAMVYCAESAKTAIIDNKIKSVDDMLKHAYRGNRLTKLLRYTEKRRNLFNGEKATDNEKKDYVKVQPKSVVDASFKELVK